MAKEQRRGRKIAMDKAELDAFLAGERTCRVATALYRTEGCACRGVTESPSQVRESLYFLNKNIILTVSEDSLGQQAEVLPSILDLLDLEYVEENLYRSCAVYRDEYRLFGGQVAAQALYAAGRTVPDGRLPHSLHGYFLRQGATVKPTLFRVERDRDGQSFSARRVVAIQDGEVIFNMAVSFAAARPGVDVDAGPGPELTAPDLLPSWISPRHTSFEIRSAQQERRLPGQFWIRCTAELPDDPMLHAAILAYISDISNGLVPLEGEDMRSGPSLDHSVWFHRPARMDDWTWQDLIPHTAAGGRGLYTGTIFSRDGARVATIAQEVLFRRNRPA